MSSSPVLKTETGLGHTRSKAGLSADAHLDFAVCPTGSSSPASATDDDRHTTSFSSTAPPLPVENHKGDEDDADICKRRRGAGATIPSRPGRVVAPSLPSSTLVALQLFERLRYPRRRRPADDAEVVEIDISPQACRLLWWLLGLERENELPAEQGHATSYLPLLREGLTTIASLDELHDLGRWVLDSVRYDFVNVCDAANQIRTRLCIRMPLTIHDRTAHYAGLLFKQSIESVIREDVDALNGSSCKFTDKFYQMVEEKETGGPSTQAQRVTTRAQNRTQARSAGRRTGVAVDNEEREEKAQYEAVHPDVCIYTGDEHNMPTVIIEVGFSHPLPFDRARSYIYGSEGKCRIVVCLDIEYKPREVRQQIYDRVLSDRQQQQSYQERLPPYGLTLNLFRCDLEACGDKIVYVTKHDLRDLDVRGAARQGKALELRAADLSDPADDEDSAYEEQGSNVSKGEDDLITIPYDDIVQLVDKAAWVHAVGEQPSLQPKQRKRRWEAKMPSTSPEPGQGSGHSRRKRVKR